MGKDTEMRDTELYQAILGLRSPWRVIRVELHLEENRVDVWVKEEPGTRWRCPACDKESPLHDHAEERVWRHLNTCQYHTYLHARIPRTNCTEHGVRQVAVDWSEPNSHFTLLYERWLIDVLKECDVTGAVRLTDTKWDAAWKVVEKAVARGMSRKERRIPEYLGVDEKAFAKRHRYETLVCDLMRGTVEFVVEDRKQESLEKYYQQFTSEELSEVRAVAMDMWDPFITATKAHVPEADEKIVFDRFHVVRQVNDAVDKVRRAEHKELMADGDDCLKKTRYLWLSNKENVPDSCRKKFARIRRSNLKTGRAWAIKESLRKFWNYRYAGCARNYFQSWYFWATHSRLEPVINAAKTLKRHLPNIMTYFRHRISNAVAEGLNSKIQMVKEMACGFRNREHYRLAIYFHCGGLDLYPRLEAGR